LNASASSLIKVGALVTFDEPVKFQHGWTLKAVQVEQNHPLRFVPIGDSPNGMVHFTMKRKNFIYHAIDIYYNLAEWSLAHPDLDKQLLELRRRLNARDQQTKENVWET